MLLKLKVFWFNSDFACFLPALLNPPLLTSQSKYFKFNFLSQNNLRPCHTWLDNLHNTLDIIIYISSYVFII